MATNRTEFFRKYREKNRAKLNEASRKHMQKKRENEQYREKERERNRMRTKVDPEIYLQNRLNELKQAAEKRGVNLNDVIKKEYDATKMNDTVKNISVKKIKHSVNQVKTDEPAQRVCIFCGEFFKPIRVTAKYCSDNCRVKYNYRNKRKE